MLLDVGICFSSSFSTQAQSGETHTGVLKDGNLSRLLSEQTHSPEPVAYDRDSTPVSDDPMDVRLSLFDLWL